MEAELNIDEMLFDFESSQDVEDETADYGSDTFSEMLFDDDDESDEMLMFTPALTAASADNDQVTVQGMGEMCGSRAPDRMEVISQIESMIKRVIEGHLDGSQQLSIQLLSRANLNRRNGGDAESHTSVPAPRPVSIKFPAVIIRILELIHGGLVDNTIMTKRDIYYRHPDLFMKQVVVDRYVDDLACTFGVTRSLLNVVATAKGLIAGNFVLRRQDGTCIYGLSEKEGLLVPKLHAEDILDLTSVRNILVIEKEATFRTLLSSKQWKALGAWSLVLTAKGYPDLASRKFLRRVADEYPRIAIFALVDFDPDGIAILSTYKHGSYRLAHEDVLHNPATGLRLPELQWLGVKSHHIMNEGAATKVANTTTLADTQGLMRLTTRDRRKAQRMLEWDLCAEGGLEPKWRAELQRMLMLNIKAEMQILDEVAGSLVSWLGNELGVKQGAGSEKAAGSSHWDDELLF